MSEKAPTSSPEPTSQEKLVADMQERQLGTDVDRAHREALKEYREHDYARYRDHVAQLADAEKSEDGKGSTGRHFQRLGRRENLKDDVQDYLDEKKNQARQLGTAAVLLATTLRIGATKVGSDYLLKKQIERGYQKNGVERPDEEVGAESLGVQLENETSRESFTGRARKFGKKTIDFFNQIYVEGLRETDPDKADRLLEEFARKEEREKNVAERATTMAKQRERIQEVLSHVDFRANMHPNVYELIASSFAPEESVVEDDSVTLLSGTFKDISDNKHYAVAYHKLEDGALLPLLMRMDKDKSWTADTSLLPEALAELLPDDEYMAQLSERLTTTDIEEKEVEHDHIEAMIALTNLNQPKKEQVEEESHLTRRRKALMKKYQEQAKQREDQSQPAKKEDPWAERQKIAQEAREQAAALREKRKAEERKAA